MQQLFTLHDIFDKKVFSIPDYQRGYSWEREHLQAFWEDLENIQDGHNHHMGVITVQRPSQQQCSNWQKEGDAFAQIDRRKQMKAIKLDMPDDVYEKLENLASHDHQSVNVFALRKLEEFARAVGDFRELERRAQRGSRAKFQAAMLLVPNAAPEPGDEP
jgi:hypothetical protein